MVEINPKITGSGLSSGIKGSKKPPYDPAKFVTACFEESKRSKRLRLDKNKVNMDAFLGIQDWSHKIEGQSKQTLPKVGIACEQFSAFVNRALVQGGTSWYEFTIPSEGAIPAYALKRLIDFFFYSIMLSDGSQGNIVTQIVSALKLASLESVAVLKVHGQRVPESIPSVNFGIQKEIGWRLRVDLIPFESYYEDPTGHHLYEIHETEQDLWFVQEKADEGTYDKKEVKKLVESYTIEDDDRLRSDEKKNQTDARHTNSFRHTVVIKEFWGTLLDEDGSIFMRNCFCVIANDRFVLVEPTENPFYHGQSPFVKASIMKVPFSVHHKALFDEAAELNEAMNEMFSLFLDGAISSVWGISQLKADYLLDKSQIEGGIGQGDTLLVNSTMPPGEKVMEKIIEGSVPGDSMAIFELLNKEFAACALSNELKLGQLPGRKVLATEVTELNQGQNLVLDSLVAQIEMEFLTPLVAKATSVILQHLTLLNSDRLFQLLGEEHTTVLGDLIHIGGSEGLFGAIVGSIGIRVRGLSQMMKRTRDFQQFAALMQIITANPMLAASFYARYSPEMLIGYMIKSLGIDPDDLEAAGRELPETEFMRIQMAQQMAQQASGGGMNGDKEGINSGGPNDGDLKNEGDSAPQNVPGQGAPAAEINQRINPMTGLSPNR